MASLPGLGAVFSDNTERQKSTLAEHHSFGSHAALTTMASKQHATLKSLNVVMSLHTSSLKVTNKDFNPQLQFELNLRWLSKTRTAGNAGGTPFWKWRRR